MDRASSSSSSNFYYYNYDYDENHGITSNNNLSRFGDPSSIREYHPLNHHSINTIRPENQVPSYNIDLHDAMTRLAISDEHAPIDLNRIRVQAAIYEHALHQNYYNAPPNSPNNPLSDFGLSQYLLSGRRAVPNQHRRYHHQKNRSRHNNNYNNNGHVYYTSLDQIRGRVANMAMEKEGSAYLQKRLKPGISTEEFDMIFREIEERVCELMVDWYGNHVIQDIYQLCTEEKINRIFRVVSQTQERLVEICLDINGSRAIQKLMECMKTQNQIWSMVSVLNPIAMLLATSANGYHVILNCVSLFPSEATEMIVSLVANSCVELAMDKFGCHVVGACIGNSTGEVQLHMHEAIIEDAVFLAEHPYGNYVIQNIVESGNEYACEGIFRQFEKRLVRLSTNKFGSNVVEKCLSAWWRTHRSIKMIIELMLAPTFVSAILMNEFGNFVAQTALEVAEGKLLIALIRKIQSHDRSILHHPYGRKVLNKTKKEEFLHRKNLLSFQS